MLSDGDFEFNLTLEEIAHFYLKVMKGQRRKDGIIKGTRDFEYPWVIIKANVQSTDKVLDCGAGNSPIPFIWATTGAEVHAIDNSVMICSRPVYLLRNLPTIGINFVLGDRKASLRKLKRVIGRTWKPDFWNPVSPKLVKKYKINYKIGDIRKLPYDNCTFDIVSCVSVLEHMSNQSQIIMIKEMARVLKQGGKLLITYDLDNGDLTIKYVEASGLRLVETTYYEKAKPKVVGIYLTKGDSHG